MTGGGHFYGILMVMKDTAYLPRTVEKNQLRPMPRNQDGSVSPLRTWLLSFKKRLGLGKTKPEVPVDTSALIRSYAAFVENAIERYLHDYDVETDPLLKHRFYNRFCKTFLDELAAEIYRLDQEQGAAIPDRGSFRAVLQKLADDGMKKLKSLTT